MRNVHQSDSSISRHLFTVSICLAVSILMLAGCEIEESDKGLTGSVYVTLSDTAGVEITGAEIRIDGTLLSQRTPATLRDLPIGPRTISVARPGFVDTSLTVEVRLNQTVTAELRTVLAPVGFVELAGAPDGTVLLVNTLQSGTVPPTQFLVGIGNYEISAYLPGHATNLPSLWPTAVTVGDTVIITPQFTPAPSGARPDSLAPVFTHATDWDSSSIQLQDYRGRVCVVTFFFYYCVPCLEEFPYIQDVYEDPDYSGKVQVFAVDSQDPWSLFERYREDHPTLGITFPLLHDPMQSTNRNYAIQVHPTNLIIDKTGRIRYRFGQITPSVLRGAIDVLMAEGE